jgi:hypothetical protein
MIPVGLGQPAVGRAGMMSWLEKGLSNGASLAIYTLFLLWTDLLGMHLGALYAWLPVIFGIILIGWRNWEKLRSFSVLRNYVKSQVSLKMSWASISMMLLIFLLFTTRFWATVSMLLRGDSFQHSVITPIEIRDYLPWLLPS